MVVVGRGVGHLKALAPCIRRRRRRGGAARRHETAAFGGAERPAGGPNEGMWGACPHADLPGPTSRCGPRLPGGPLRPMKGVMTIEAWYYCASTASNSKATMLVILIIGLTAGPAVSL